MKKAALLCFCFIGCILSLQGQILQKTIESIGRLQDVSYTTLLKQKDFFSDKLIYDTAQTIIVQKKGKVTYSVKTVAVEEIFDGSKLFRLNWLDTTYRIFPGIDNAIYYSKSLPYLKNILENNINKQAVVKQLKDSIIDKQACFHIQIIELDSLRNNKHVFTQRDLLIDKITYLPLYHKMTAQGFIDGTDTFIEVLLEYTFTNYKTNQRFDQDIILTTLPAFFTLEKPSNPKPLLANGTVAPEMQFSNASREMLISQLKGKAILLNFTTIGCPHCIESINILNTLHEKYKDLAVISINVFDTQEDINAFNKKFHVKYSVYTATQKATTGYNVESYPLFYLIDKAGIIVKSYAGYYKALDDQFMRDIENVAR